jgi:hypothetical protein
MFVTTIVNRSDSTEKVERGGCWAFLRLYTNAARTGAPTYDSAQPGLGCTLELVDLRIAPHDSGQFNGSIPGATIVAEGTPPGHYYAAIAVAPNGVATELPAGEIDLKP